MVSFYAIPTGAALMLVLYLLRVPYRVLSGVFYATLVFAFAANVAEWGSGIQEICKIFRVDDFTRFFSLLFIFVVAFGALNIQYHTLVYDTGAENRAIILTLLLLATFAMILVASSTSVISLFLSMEFLAIAFYELVALKKDQIGMEGAIKFFVVGVFSSLLFLLGAAFYYGALGTVNFSALLNAKPTPFLVSSLLLMLVGVGFKMSIFPLNLWLPDVYQGSPGAITAILAGAAKKAGFAAYLRLFIPLGLPMLRLGNSLVVPWRMLMGLTAVLTMLFGTIAAALQQNVKRLIAYSIIAHAGFIAMGLAAATPLGYRAALLHIVTHATMAVGVFTMIGALERRGFHTLDDYSGIAKHNAGFAALFTIFLASLTGIPPLAGFFSKFLLAVSAIQADMLWLAVAAVVSSIISSYFYFVVLRSVYGYKPQKSTGSMQLSLSETLSFTVPAVLLVVFGFAPQMLLAALERVLY